MAQTITMAIIFVVFNLFSLHFLQSIALISSGFSLKLTHRDSPHSPLYQPNLSNFERFIKNVDISKTRAFYFEKRSETIDEGRKTRKLKNESFQLPLIYHEPLFTVELGLGTPVVKRNLIFDTGSGLTWTQCKPCVRCFKQNQPLFDVRKSRSYKMVAKKDKLSKRFTCNIFGCFYYVQYYSGQISAGIASFETFAFQTTKGNYRNVPGLVFGCGTINQGSFGSTNAVSGIFGLDKEPVSFARQLGGLMKDRFSYCLPELDSTAVKDSYLRFGDEATKRNTTNATQSTPFLKTNRNEIFYLLNLTEISINGQKLGLTEDTFPGGCVIDSGSSISLLNTKAFTAVKNSFDGYFSKFKNVRRIVRKTMPEGFVCYTRPTGFTEFPNMTFHFQGGDFRVPSGNLFMFQRRFFCLAMLESEKVTILGAYQQQNVRILYDLKDEMLSFASEDCSKDAAA
ncbi:hypothetical protein DH2020_034152 [Rehmannia glutinosa]|uniref:Peptidase A1 domain-containing protein n=1 Tax=Rehmannia glutinosa TaxID=99300 RepID=A0ABR0VD79_REHGL